MTTGEVFLLRHAEKDDKPSKSDRFGNDVPLTSKGYTSAIEFGGVFIEKYGMPAFIRTSPLRRCVETAEAIRRGINADIPVEKCTLLGDPGPFVTDPEQAGKSYLMYGNAVIEMLLNGEDVPGFRSVEEGVNDLMDIITKDIRDTSHPVLYITHDTVMVPFYYWLADDSKIVWPDFLEYIHIYVGRKGKLFMLRGGI